MIDPLVVGKAEEKPEVPVGGLASVIDTSKTYKSSAFRSNNICIRVLTQIKVPYYGL